MNRKNFTRVHNDIEQTGSAGRLNWLRASVLGANDGIVSVAGLVVGVAGATSSTGIILTAGLAGIISGALSMAAGEYVSVSTQRDTEKALLQKEAYELKTYPKEELEELTQIYIKKGLKEDTAHKVALELSSHDVFAAHVDAELGINPNNLTSPWQAALASALSFFAGAMIPLIAIIAPPAESRILITFIAVLFALSLTGYLSAKAGEAPARRATLRVIIGGLIAMAVTYGIGHALGVSMS